MVKPRYDLRLFDITEKGYELLAKLKFTTFLEDGTRTITCKGGTDLHKSISDMVEMGHLKVEVLRQFNYPGELQAARNKTQHKPAKKRCPHCGGVL